MPELDDLTDFFSETNFPDLVPYLEHSSQREWVWSADDELASTPSNQPLQGGADAGAQYQTSELERLVLEVEMIGDPNDAQLIRSARRPKDLSELNHELLLTSLRERISKAKAIRTGRDRELSITEFLVYRHTELPSDMTDPLQITACITFNDRDMLVFYSRFGYAAAGTAGEAPDCKEINIFHVKTKNWYPPNFLKASRAYAFVCRHSLPLGDKHAVCPRCMAKIRDPDPCSPDNKCPVCHTMTDAAVRDRHKSFEAALTWPDSKFADQDSHYKLGASYVTQLDIMRTCSVKSLKIAAHYLYTCLYGTGVEMEFDFRLLYNAPQATLELLKSAERQKRNASLCVKNNKKVSGEWVYSNMPNWLQRIYDNWNAAHASNQEPDPLDLAGLADQQMQMMSRPSQVRINLEYPLSADLVQQAGEAGTSANPLDVDGNGAVVPAVSIKTEPGTSGPQSPTRSETGSSRGTPSDAKRRKKQGDSKKSTSASGSGLVTPSPRTPVPGTKSALAGGQAAVARHTRATRAVASPIQKKLPGPDLALVKQTLKKKAEAAAAQGGARPKVRSETFASPTRSDASSSATASAQPSAHHEPMETVQSLTQHGSTPVLQQLDMLGRPVVIKQEKVMSLSDEEREHRNDDEDDEEAEESASDTEVPATPLPRKSRAAVATSTPAEVGETQDDGGDSGESGSEAASQQDDTEYFANADDDGLLDPSGNEEDEEEEDDGAGEVEQEDQLMDTQPAPESGTGSEPPADAGTGDGMAVTPVKLPVAPSEPSTDPAAGDLQVSPGAASTVSYDGSVGAVGGQACQGSPATQTAHALSLASISDGSSAPTTRYAKVELRDQTQFGTVAFPPAPDNSTAPVDTAGKCALAAADGGATDATSCHAYCGRQFVVTLADVPNDQPIYVDRSRKIPCRNPNCGNYQLPHDDSVTEQPQVQALLCPRTGELLPPPFDQPADEIQRTAGVYRAVQSNSSLVSSTTDLDLTQRPVTRLERTFLRCCFPCGLKEPGVEKYLEARFQEWLDQAGVIANQAGQRELVNISPVTNRLGINTRDYENVLPRLSSLPARYPEEPLMVGILFGTVRSSDKFPVADWRLQLFEELARALIKALAAIECALQRLVKQLERIEHNHQLVREIAQTTIPALVFPVTDAAVLSVELLHQLVTTRRQCILKLCRAAVSDYMQALTTPILGVHQLF